jgi:predicted Co/Zn/Cd cation transporter (cation efflux family)
MLEGTFMNEYLVYTDAFATLLIILIVIKLPLQAIYSGIREILLSAPPAEIIEVVDVVASEVFLKNNIKEFNFKITKTGREIYVLFHAKVQPVVSIPLQDVVKEMLLKRISEEFDENIKIDVCFTAENLKKIF